MPTLVRHACPTLVAPMESGDGLLARLPPLVRPLTPDQFGRLAHAAARHGNGLVEISRRGNVQIRGLRAGGGPALAADLAAADIELPAGPPVSGDPFARPEESGVDLPALVAALHHGIEQAGISTRLAPKLSIAVDTATACSPRELDADLRLAFVAGQVRIGLGGDCRTARWLGAAAASDAVAAALAILEALSAFGPAARLAGGDGLRERPEIDRAVAPFLVAEETSPMPLRSPAALPVVAFGFAFGQCHADELAALGEMASRKGFERIAPLPGRRLVLAGPAAAMPALSDAAARLGFIVAPGDPRRAIAACIGSEGCRAGRMACRPLAARIAAAAPSLLDGSFTLHLSGCAKGCAHPEPAALTVTAIDKGASFVLHGRARDEAAGSVASGDLPERLAALAGEVERRRRPGETAAAVLERMGAALVTRMLAKGNGTRQDGGEPRLSA